MANKITNFSDLINRVTATCLLHPLASTRHTATKHPGDRTIDIAGILAADQDSDEEKVEVSDEKENLMSEVFEAVSEMKRAYVRLQEAHSPYDPEKMRVADEAVVSELRRIGVLRERFRRCGGGRQRRHRGETVREVVAPYEAAVEELKKEVKEKEVEIQNLKEKMRLSSLSGSNTTTTTSSSNRSNGGFGKKQGRRSNQRPIRVSCITQTTTIQGAPTQELFEAMARQVRETSKSFTSLLLSLMRSAHWDILAAVRSIELAFTTTTPTASTITTIHHAKYALQSYLSNKIFQGFDHETFYMDGSLSSLLNPDQFRRDCFTQYCDMKSMDPIELLGVLPSCHFGKFCSRKYLSIIHPKMEESLFGNVEQHHQVLDGNHPRSQFYGEFLGLAKSVWLLHLLAFSLEPCPNYFEASRGAEFHAQYMESVVKFPSDRLPVGQIVGFPVSPGFKLGNGSVIKSRVHLVSKT